MLFLYQSNDTQRLYQRYGKHIVLLDAACKTTEYSLPLYFLVVQTNVNYQVVAAIVTQEETTFMLSKALQIIKGNFSTFILVSYSVFPFLLACFLLLLSFYALFFI